MRVRVINEMFCFSSHPFGTPAAQKCQFNLEDVANVQLSEVCGGLQVRGQGSVLTCPPAVSGYRGNNY